MLSLKGMKPVRSKICINDRILKEINIFIYLVCNISNEKKKDLNANSVKILTALDCKRNMMEIQIPEIPEFTECTMMVLLLYMPPPSSGLEKGSSSTRSPCLLQS
jgi:hypothetical protein